VKKYFGLALGASIVVLAQSCSSDSGTTKKKFDGGAEAGEGGESPSGGSGGTAGRANGGTGGSAGRGGSGGAAGNSATAGEGGASTSGGSAGAAGETSSASGGAGGEAGGGALVCAPGYADCDTDPTTCETSLNLVTSCGSCTKACNGAHGTVACQNEACKLTACDNGYADCDNDPSSGCEQSLSADDHCGSCTRNCAAYGATCTTGRCNAVTIGTNLPFGSDNGGLNNWALNGGNLYEAGYYAYNIVRVPTNGSATSTVWSKSTAYIGNHSLITTATDILWAERGAPSVMLKKSLTADSATVPATAWVPEYQPTFMRALGTAFYWASGDYQAGEPGYIYTRSQTAASTDPGTRIVTVDQGTHGAILDFNVTSDSLYWVTSAPGTGTAYELRTTPLAGGTPKAVPAIPGVSSTAVSDGAVSSVLVRVLGKTVYYNYHVGSSALNGIYSFNVGDTAPTQLVPVTNAQSLEVDASGIYYTDANVSGVFKAPLTGGVGAQVTSSLYTGRIVALDSTFIYFAAPGCCASGVYKIIK